MKRLLLILLLLSLVLISSCETKFFTPTSGVLEGKVTLKECNALSMAAYPCRISNDKENYKLRKIIIFDQAYEKPERKEISIDENGYYNLSLTPGEYLVDINYYSKSNSDENVDVYTDEDKSPDVPKIIKIESDKKVILDIVIEHWYNQII